MPDRCRRGHLLDEDNRYEETAPGGRTVVRCRTCRNEQRSRQRRRAQARPPGQLDLEALAARQHPSEADIKRAVELWANGTAGDACRQASVSVAKLARIAGCNPNTARLWLQGAPIQRRYQTKAAAILLALGTIKPPEPEAPAARTGDAVLLIGGRPDQDGPWHHSPPHSGAEISLRIYENWYGSGNPTGPKFTDYWPCQGLIANHNQSTRLLKAHGYLEDPRTHEHASRCHGTPGWQRDCPNGDGTTGETGCKGIQLTTAAWAIHMADLYDGRGCTPDNCPITTPQSTAR
jgi:hypothetical protein